MAPPGVNSFYYYALTAFDPLMSLSAVFLIFFDPEGFMQAGFARTSPLAQLNASHIYVLQQFGGAFAMFAFLMIFMLPQTDDLQIWRRFQQGLLFTDASALYAMFQVVAAQGGEWRLEAIGNTALLIFIATIRICFVAGVGMKKPRATGKSM